MTKADRNLTRVIKLDAFCTQRIVVLKAYFSTADKILNFVWTTNDKFFIYCRKKKEQTHFTQVSTKGYDFITEQMPVVAIIRETFNPPLRHVAETNTHNSV